MTMLPARRSVWLRLTFAVATAVLLAAPARAQEPQEGFEYEVLNPPMARLSADRRRIELVEFFWYQCPHCNTMWPLLEPWAKKNARRIAFVRVPYALNPDYALQSRLYYALQSLGKAEQLHTLIFQAIHDEKIPMRSLNQMAEFLEQEGIARERFFKAMAAPAVVRKTEDARELAERRNITRVPTLVIDGRYLTSATHVGGTQAEALKVAEWLVAKVERERAGKKAGK